MGKIGTGKVAQFFKEKVGPGIKQAMLGKPEQTTRLPIFTDEQLGALNDLLQMGLGGIKGQQFDFAPIEQRARTQFQQQTIPSIAERFTALGGQNSSGFQQALGQAGAGLEQSLAALRSQYGLQERDNLFKMLGIGLTPQYESLFRPASPGFLQNLFTSGAQNAQQYLPFLMQMASGGAGAGMGALGGLGGGMMGL